MDQIFLDLPAKSLMLWRADAVSDETITRVTLYLDGKTLLRRWGDAQERRMGFIVRIRKGAVICGRILENFPTGRRYLEHELSDLLWNTPLGEANEIEVWREGIVPIGLFYPEEISIREKFLLVLRAGRQQWFGGSRLII